MTDQRPKSTDPPVNPIANLKIGDRLGRFKVTGKLGRGSMGWVVKAQDITLKRQVALKLVPYQSDDPEQRQFAEQFIREARAAASLIHPGIVQIFEVGVDKGMIFIAMEILNGGTLEDIVDESGPMQWPRAVELCIQAAEGLAYAHGRGLVHRDIKPANIMLADSGHCKVTDFGLAHFDAADEQTSAPWTVVGTPYYMAPEAGRGQATAQSDIFSLAGVLWFMLIGKPPFDIRHLSDVLKVGRELPLASLKHERPDVPDKLVRILEAALSHEQDFRHQTAQEFGKELRTLLNKAERTAVAKPVKRKRRGPVVAMVVVLLLIAAASGGIWFATRSNDVPADTPSANNQPQPPPARTPTAGHTTR